MLFPELIWVTFAALVASTLTFFSGFGLGTLLLPVFAWFTPLPVAISATAIVHLANNLFKAVLAPRQINWQVIRSFTVPAALAALSGAVALNTLSDNPPLLAYAFGGHLWHITPLKMVVGLLMMGFALLELHPRFNELTFPPRLLPLGGFLSGFFGGLSGHQGALRSAFLIRLGLDKQAYVSTIIWSAIIVDVTRLAVYGIKINTASLSATPKLASIVIVGCLSAFAGSLIGARLLNKVTMAQIQGGVAFLLIGYGIAMILGWI